MIRVSYRAANNEHLTDTSAVSDSHHAPTNYSESAIDQRKVRRVRTPVQKRSKATYEKILAVSAELIVEHGLDGFTTNAVADRAGINIATVYSYFPDKLAILEKLVVRTEQLRTDQFTSHLTTFAGNTWQTWLTQVVESLVEFRLHHPVGKALRTVALATPEWRHLHDDSTSQAAAALATALRTRNGGLTDQQAHHICEVAIRSATGVLDQATSDGVRNDALISELLHMLTAYLARYLTVRPTTT